jgi:hypothetical protein
MDRATLNRCLAALVALLTVAAACKTGQLNRRQQQPVSLSVASAAAAATTNCSATQLVATFLASPLPPRNLNISVENPLLFVHQRKAGGSSVRVALVAAAAQARLPSYVPCHGGVKCTTFDIPVNAAAAIYAGHFPWIHAARQLMQQRQLGRSGSTPPSSGATPDTIQRQSLHQPASCLTLFRDPMARLESCFYYRAARVNVHTPACCF